MGAVPLVVTGVIIASVIIFVIVMALWVSGEGK